VYHILCYTTLDVSVPKSWYHSLLFVVGHLSSFDDDDDDDDDGGVDNVIIIGRRVIHD
jgi:hypothetical protein